MSGRGQSALAQVSLGKKRADHRGPDVAGPELVRKGSLKLGDTLFTLSDACERPAAHRARDAEELGMDDFGLECQSPLRFDQRPLGVAADLKRPRQLRQRLCESGCVPESF